MFKRKKFLLARRLVQLSILASFILGPCVGFAIAKGTLASSKWFGFLLLSDPFVLLQSMVAGHKIATSAIVGGLIIAVFYVVFGGRLFCGWVCPVNMVTDSARGLRRFLGLKKANRLRLDKRLRFVMIIGVLSLSAISGVVVWELINPINLVVRSLVFGLWFGGLIAVSLIFCLDFFLLSNGWCGHICPVGGFYKVVGKRAVMQVATVRRADCNNCGDCFEYCPEPQVITPALRGKDGHDIYINDADCLRCGRCLDVCDQNVFTFSILNIPKEQVSVNQRIKLG